MKILYKLIETICSDKNKLLLLESYPVNSIEPKDKYTIKILEEFCSDQDRLCALHVIGPLLQSIDSKTIMKILSMFCSDQSRLDALKCLSKQEVDQNIFNSKPSIDSKLLVKILDEFCSDHCKVQASRMILDFNNSVKTKQISQTNNRVSPLSTKINHSKSIDARAIERILSSFSNDRMKLEILEPLMENFSSLEFSNIFDTVIDNLFQQSSKIEFVEMVECSNLSRTVLEKIQKIKNSGSKSEIMSDSKNGQETVTTSIVMNGKGLSIGVSGVTSNVLKNWSTTVANCFSDGGVDWGKLAGVVFGHTEEE